MRKERGEDALEGCGLGRASNSIASAAPAGYPRTHCSSRLIRSLRSPGLQLASSASRSHEADRVKRPGLLGPSLYGEVDCGVSILFKFSRGGDRYQCSLPVCDAAFERRRSPKPERTYAKEDRQGANCATTECSSCESFKARRRFSPLNTHALHRRIQPPTELVELSIIDRRLGQLEPRRRTT